MIYFNISIGKLKIFKNFENFLDFIILKLKIIYYNKLNNWRGVDTIGLFSSLFKKKNKKIPDSKSISYLQVDNSSTYLKKNLDVYSNHTVRKVVNKIAELVASTPIRYYSTDTSGKVIDNKKSDIIWCLQHQATYALTSFKFLKQMVGRAILYNNSFAWIHRDSYTGELIELIPILAKQYSLITPKENPGYLYFKFTLKDGVVKILPIEEIIHFTGDFLENEYFGDDTAPAVEVVSINDDLWSNLVKWTQANSSIKGFLKTDTILNEDDKKEAQDEFKNLLNDNASAYMTLDGKFDYVPINDKTSPMDINYIEKIESTIRDFFSISLPIVQGVATPQQMEAFHQLVLHPLFTMIEQEFESKLLTKKQIIGFNHQIKFVCNTFEHMTASEATSAYTLLTNTGAISRNELREGFGFERIEGLDTLMYSKNFAEVGKTDETTNIDNDEGGQDNATGEGN